MRYLKLISIVTLLISFQLSAQENKSKKVYFGINLGANMFELNQSNIFDAYNETTSYSFGISAEYKISEKLSLLSGLNYDRKVLILEDYTAIDINNNFLQ